MIIKKIPLIEGNESAYLTAYLADVKKPVRDAMLVIPGGGYGCVCSDREGEPIALAFVATREEAPAVDNAEVQVENQEVELPAEGEAEVEVETETEAE